MQSMHKQDIRGQVNAISPRTTGCCAPGFETMQTFHYLETEFPRLNSNLHHYVTKLMINGYNMSSVTLGANHLETPGQLFPLSFHPFQWGALSFDVESQWLHSAKMDWDYFLLFRMNWSQITASEISRRSWQMRLQMNSRKAVEVQSTLRLV